MKKYLILLIGLWAGNLSAQLVYPLDSLISLAVKNNPLSLNTPLYQEQFRINSEILDANFYPTMDLNAKASYQSDVTSIDIPIPGIDIPSLPKDQYGVYLELSQLIYDGGSTSAAKKLKEIESQAAVIKNKTDRYPIYKSISALYFNYLLAKTNQSILESKQEVLNKKIEAAQYANENGMLKRNQLDELKAGELLLEQQLIDLTNIQSLILKKISILCGTEIKDENLVMMPRYQFEFSDYNKQPVFRWIDAQEQVLKSKQDLLSASRKPKLMAFSQAGYAKPGLNMFSDNFDTYYLLGVKLKWNIYDWKTSRKQQTLLQIGSQFLEHQSDQLRQVSDLKSQDYIYEIAGIDQKIEKATQLIELQKNILERSNAAFENGTLTSADYIEVLNNFTQAQFSLEKLKIQKIAAAWNYKIENGNQKKY